MVVVVGSSGIAVVEAGSASQINEPHLLGMEHLRYF
jgi:hypothetical protein